MTEPINELSSPSMLGSIIKQVQHHQNGGAVFRFPHSVDSIKILETHISWIVLTGNFAYKLKKPVQFDFVDYSDVRKRQTYCHREIELNRRYAPEIYLDVCPIYNIDGAIVFGEVKDKLGDNLPIDYAVKMREFPQSSIAANALPKSENRLQLIERFGHFIAGFHEKAERTELTSPDVDPENLYLSCRQNFESLQHYAFGNDAIRQIDQLHSWTESQLQRLKPAMERRLENGFVRRCHGDLHLSNIILVDDKLVPFDGIEFNPQFYWIDVFSEVAFVVMDLAANGFPELAWRFLNSYIESTGDTEDLEILTFYLVYRAMVRAKITAMQLESGCDNTLKKLHQYLDSAHSFAFQSPPQLTITFGFSGSGKSTAAMNWIDSKGGIRLRSDVARSNIPTEHRYDKASIDGVYSKIYEMAKNILEAGYSVVVDATFLQKQHRDRFLILSNGVGVKFNILKCDAQPDELARRIQNRKDDPSEATLEVLENQIKNHDPLTEAENRFIVPHDSAP